MKGKILIAVSMLILSSASIAQTVTDAVLPLSPLNNFWVYDNDGFSKSTYQITDTAKYIDSIKYSEVEVRGLRRELVRLREDGFYVFRRDSSYLQPNHEQIYYKKDAQFGDQWVVIPDSFPLTDTVYYTVIDTLTANIFNTTVKSKLIFITNNGLFNHYQIWTEEFGMMAEDVGEGFTYQLKGCVIDGVVYGDTTTTTVDIKDDILDLKYSLSQNYPNPFNPSTTIEYELFSQSHIKLMVFNSLGELIDTLVDQDQSQGKYKVNFSAEHLSTGVYLYRLTNGIQSLTNKMVVLK